MKLLYTLAFCCLICLRIAAQAAPQKTSRPNVFLITIDTLRADHVHCYGYDRVKTPAIDGLAKDGFRFAQAFTPSPITNTSHATILTGLLPSTHGVTDFAVPLSTAHSTWAELLRKQGYHTAAFIGAVILDSKSLAPGFDRGFDFYDNFPERSSTKPRRDRVERRGLVVVQNAEAWLTAHAAGTHFIWVHLYDPHDPYEPPPPYSEIYKDHLYDGEIAYADSALGNFIAYLKAHKIYDSSLIVLVGDHGEGLGEHHEETHGIFLYDSTTHVPLIVKLPGHVAAAKVVDDQVRTTDILPTVLEVLGVAALDTKEGESLKPYLVGTQTAPRTAIGETDYSLRFGWSPLRSVRMEGFKFIEAPRPEFYDLHHDAGELDNKYEPWNAQVQKSRALLAALHAAEPPKTSASSVRQGTIDELKALGYLGRADVGSATNVPEPTLLPDPKDRIEEQNLLHAAMIASSENRTADARELLEKALQLNPKSPTALRDLGEMELHAGDNAKAAEHLKAALEARPDDTEVSFHLGEALKKVGDLPGARDTLEASLKVLPGRLQARLLLGEIYLALKDPNHAEDQFEAALLLQSGSVEAQLGIASAQLAANKFAEALSQLEPLSKAHPDDAEIFDLLAKTYTGLGNLNAAQQAQSRAKVLGAKKNKRIP